MKPTICVVYIVREQQAIMPFLQSYWKHPAGIEHTLLLLTKGRRVVLPIQAACMPNHLEAFMSDIGHGLRAYSAASRKFDFEYFCCLNSWTELLADDWLAKFYSVASSRKVGIAGATGSAESFCSSRPALFNRFPFDPFPNYHIRGTGFMMRRELMLKTWPRLMLTQAIDDALEHGSNSITNQIRRMGLAPVVVGRNGAAYSMDNWESANVYRTYQQENLLIADKQTKLYAAADQRTRASLRLRTWGPAPARRRTMEAYPIPVAIGSCLPA